MVTQLTDNEYKFLKKLDKKLHYTYQSTMTPNMFGNPHKVYDDWTTGESLTKIQLEKILDIYNKKNDLLLYPEYDLWDKNPVFKLDQIILTPDYYKRLNNEKDEIIQKKREFFSKLNKYERITFDILGFDNSYGDHKLSDRSGKY